MELLSPFPKLEHKSKQLHGLYNGSDRSALPTSACEMSLFRNWCRKVAEKWPFFILLSHLMHHIYPTLHGSKYSQHIHPLIEEKLSRCHNTLEALLNEFPHSYKSVPCEKENFTYSFFQILSCKLWATASSCPALKKPFFSLTFRFIFVFKYTAWIQSSNLAIKMHPREQIGN